MKKSKKRLIRKESLSDLEIEDKERRKQKVFNKVASGDDFSNYSRPQTNKSSHHRKKLDASYLTQSFISSNENSLIDEDQFASQIMERKTRPKQLNQHSEQFQVPKEKDEFQKNVSPEDEQYSQNIYIEQGAQYNPLFFGDPIGNPVMQVRRNLALSISDAVNESLCINSTLLIISVAKIIAFLYLIFGEEQSCKLSLTLWLVLMFVHDVELIYYSSIQILYLIYSAVLISVIRSNDYQEDPNAEGGLIQRPKLSRTSFLEDIAIQDQLRGRRSEVNRIVNEIDQWDQERNINAFSIQEKATSSKNSLNYLEKFTRQYYKIYNISNSYYIILFIWGNFVLIGDIHCGEVAPTHFNVAVVFLIIGYAYAGIPIILFVSICLCLPLVLLLYLLISNNETQRPIKKDILEHLQKIKYKPGLIQGESKECCICMIDYKDFDNLIILPCNKIHRHHFHEVCVKKWLQVNGVCPICRKPVEESFKQMNIIQSSQ